MENKSFICLYHVPLAVSSFQEMTFVRWPCHRLVIHAVDFRTRLPEVVPKLVWLCDLGQVIHSLCLIFICKIWMIMIGPTYLV